MKILNWIKDRFRIGKKPDGAVVFIFGRFNVKMWEMEQILDRNMIEIANHFKPAFDEMVKFIVSLDFSDFRRDLEKLRRTL